MKTITINLFKFDELSYEIRESLIGYFDSHCGIDYDGRNVEKQLINFLISIGFSDAVHVGYCHDNWKTFEGVEIKGEFTKKDVSNFENTIVEQSDSVVWDIFKQIDNLKINNFSTSCIYYNNHYGSQDEFKSLEGTPDDAIDLMKDIVKYMFEIMKKDHYSQCSDESTAETIRNLDFDYLSDGNIIWQHTNGEYVLKDEDEFWYDGD